MVRVLGAAAGVVFILVLGAAIYLGGYDEPPVDPAWQLEGSSEIPYGSVTVRYTGTATLLFSDGETQWMTDGWFTRPGPFALLFGEIAPDLAAIDRGLARNGLAPNAKLAAVFPVHSHYDHAMDSPEVARRTGALLLGSEATANIGRGWGLPEKQIVVVPDRRPIQIGKFTLVPIESRHFQFPDPELRARALGNPDITEPLTPPATTFDYAVGKAYALYVEHPKGKWLIQGSAGFVEGGLEGFDVDTVFLGTGGLGTQTPEYRETYWRETIDRTSPSRVIPIHWDSLLGPAEGEFTGEMRAARFLSAGADETLGFLKAKERAHPKLEFSTLPRFEEVVLF